MYYNINTMKKEKIDNYNNVKIILFSGYKNFVPGKWVRFIITYKPKIYLELFKKLLFRKLFKFTKLNFSGVYAIFSGKKCLYIGESKNIGNRLKSHLNKYLITGEFWGYKNINLKVRKDKRRFERKMLEARLIEKIKPEINERNRIKWEKFK